MTAPRLLAARWLLGLVLPALACPAAAQDAAPPRVVPDTAGVIALRRLPEGHSPRGALWRAAAVPGWGQVYNRQYYKLPIVYAGLGGVAGFALYTNAQYVTYRRAHLYAAPESAWGTRGKPDYSHYEDEYLAALEKSRVSYSGDPTAESVRNRVYADFQRIRDNLRRNRDLLYIGVGLFYGLTILDAYVNAHLLDFDVGEDLTVTVFPVPGGAGAVVRAAR